MVYLIRFSMCMLIMRKISDVLADFLSSSTVEHAPSRVQASKRFARSECFFSFWIVNNELMDGSPHSVLAQCPSRSNFRPPQGDESSGHHAKDAQLRSLRIELCFEFYLCLSFVEFEFIA